MNIVRAPGARLFVAQSTTIDDAGSPAVGWHMAGTTTPVRCIRQ
jgi:hypothetical protein